MRSCCWSCDSGQRLRARDSLGRSGQPFTLRWEHARLQQVRPFLPRERRDDAQGNIAPAAHATVNDKDNDGSNALQSARGAPVPPLQHTPYNLVIVLQISTESGDADTDGPVDATGEVLPLRRRPERQRIHVQKPPRTLTSS